MNVYNILKITLNFIKIKLDKGMRPRGIKIYHLYFICCRVEIILYKHTLAKS